MGEAGLDLPKLPRCGSHPFLQRLHKRSRGRDEPFGHLGSSRHNGPFFLRVGAVGNDPATGQAGDSGHEPDQLSHLRTVLGSGKVDRRMKGSLLRV